MKFSIVDGDKYVKEVNAEYIQKSLNVSKLFLALNLDENLIDECILGILSDPIQKNYRINEVYENKNDIAELTWFYSSLRMCIIGLVLFNTVGEKKSRKWFKDELAIKVMETVMNEFNQKPEKHTLDAFSYFECIRGDSIDKKHFNLQNLVYAIICEMSCIFHYNVGETIQSFFERPFVKHYSSKDPDNVFINKIIVRWNFRYPEQKVEEDFVKKLFTN